jgi:hypothetical protein
MPLSFTSYIPISSPFILFILHIHIIMAQSFQDGVQGISNSMSRMRYGADSSDHTNPAASELPVVQLDPWYVLWRFDFSYHSYSGSSLSLELSRIDSRHMRSNWLSSTSMRADWHTFPKDTRPWDFRWMTREVSSIENGLLKLPRPVSLETSVSGPTYPEN